MIRKFFKNKPVHKGQNYKIFKSNIKEFNNNFILTNKYLCHDKSNVKIPTSYDDFINQILVFEQKINWYDKNQKSKLFIKQGKTELLDALNLFKLTGKNSHFIMKITEEECAYEDFSRKTEDNDVDYIDRNQFNL